MTVMDVAASILSKRGPMTAMKLQKLVYYAQAWSLVWDDRPLFAEPIQAWANGPVCPALYAAHKGRFQLNAGDLNGDPTSLDGKAIETVDAVLDAYGDRTSQWLSDLTHMEAPWKDARQGTPEGASSNAEISHAAMAEYYGGLDASAVRLDANVDG